MNQSSGQKQEWGKRMKQRKDKCFLKTLIVVLLIGASFLAVFLFRGTEDVEVYYQFKAEDRANQPQDLPEINNEETKIGPLPDVFESDLFSWKQVNPTAAWSKRDAHTTIVFKDKIWLFGGIDGEKGFPGSHQNMPHKSDIWASQDGKNWQLITDDAPWGERRSLTSVVFQDKIWIMGGWGPIQGYQNNVWYSLDGLNWIEAVSEAEWSPREGHALLVFDEKIWLIGGVVYDEKEFKNDVWYSEDGLDWIQATSAAPWLPRYDHTVTVFQDKMWLMGGITSGGQAKNDIWTSTDGKNWEIVTDNAAWPARQGHTSVVFKDRLWVIAGWNQEQRKMLNDVWYLKNREEEKEWKEFSSKIPPLPLHVRGGADIKIPNRPDSDIEILWTGREDHTLNVFQDKIWLMGGSGMNDGIMIWKNDIWYLYETSP